MSPCQCRAESHGYFPWGQLSIISTTLPLLGFPQIIEVPQHPFHTGQGGQFVSWLEYLCFWESNIHIKVKVSFRSSCPSCCLNPISRSCHCNRKCKIHLLLLGIRNYVVISVTSLAPISLSMYMSPALFLYSPCISCQQPWPGPLLVESQACSIICLLDQ